MVVAGVMDKIELWPKEIYDRNLRGLLSGDCPDVNLAKMTEEAFAPAVVGQEKRGERRTALRRPPEPHKACGDIPSPDHHLARGIAFFRDDPAIAQLYGPAAEGCVRL